MHTKRRWILMLTVAALSAVLSLAAMGATLVYRARSTNEFRTQTSVQCHAIESLKGAIRQVFEDQLTDLEQRRPRLDTAQYTLEKMYYQRQLGRFAPADCP